MHTRWQEAPPPLPSSMHWLLAAHCDDSQPLVLLQPIAPAASAPSVARAAKARTRSGAFEGIQRERIRGGGSGRRTVLFRVLALTDRGPKIRFAGSSTKWPAVSYVAVADPPKCPCAPNEPWPSARATRPRVPSAPAPSLRRARPHAPAPPPPPPAGPAPAATGPRAPPP